MLTARDLAIVLGEMVVMEELVQWNGSNDRVTPLHEDRPQ